MTQLYFTVLCSFMAYPTYNTIIVSKTHYISVVSALKIIASSPIELNATINSCKAKCWQGVFDI